MNQATVAVRNAQLYRQVPLAGFLQPLVERGRRFQAVPLRRRQTWGFGLAAAVLALIVVPWRIRVDGPVRLLPASRAAVTAGVDGVVKEVLRREGDRVEAGDVVATLKDEGYRAALAEAFAALAIAESDIARYTQQGDAAAMLKRALAATSRGHGGLWPKNSSRRPSCARRPPAFWSRLTSSRGSGRRFLAAPSSRSSPTRRA